MRDTLIQYINALDDQRIDPERKEQLNRLSSIIGGHLAQTSGDLNLNFICTHNSRRSVLAQVWAQKAAIFFGKKRIKCVSGGTTATAIYPMIIQTLKEAGLKVTDKEGGENPKYEVEIEPVLLSLFSKTYSHESNPKNNIIAIMTCSDADENCPFVPGAMARFALTYEDPKISDGTDAQHQVYFDRSMQIANEMFYLFSKIKE